MASTDFSLKRSKARRCLFGPVDHDVVRQDLESMLKVDNQLNNDWNYNFQKDVPVNGEGRYEWSAVEDSAYVPEFYRKGYTSRLPPTPRKVNIHNQQQTNSNVIIHKPSAKKLLFGDDCSDKLRSSSVNTTATTISSSSSVSPFTSTLPPSTPTRTPRTRRNRNETTTPQQSRISDYMSIRKRRNENESINSNQRKLPRL